MSPEDPRLQEDRRAEIRTIVKLGGELSREELRVINEVRKKEFKGFASAHRPIAPQPGTPSWDEIYVLVKQGDRVLALGRLRAEVVTFLETTHRIWGVVTVASAVKGRGYGKILLERMKDYVRESGKSAVGFCDKATSAFYRKCGFQILRNGALRFVETEPEDDSPSQQAVDDAFMLSVGDPFSEVLSSHPQEPVYLAGLRW